MIYTLVTVMLLTGKVYVEQENLSLQACAGRLALLRRETLPAMPKLTTRVGEVRYLCLPARVAVIGGRT